MNAKLVDSWEGPYAIKKRLGPVTYMLDTGSAKGKMVHVKGIKEYKERECEWIAKITTVLEKIKREMIL